MGKPFTIYVIQSAHTDIGYTHSQDQIALMYLDWYDRVLDYCQKSENDPPEHRFKWTCETAWQVRNYLVARPEREQEFLHFVRQGQIEITASYLHFTDLIDPDALRQSLGWAVNYCRRHNLPLRAALHSDINGWPWSLADALAENAIPYFCSQVHMDSATAPLGKRETIHYFWRLVMPGQINPDASLRIPQVFWWQGPQGGKVLHWLGEHYHLGNFLGLGGGSFFPAQKTRYYQETDTAPAEELYSVAKERLPGYIEEIRRGGYPLDILMISASGHLIDNSAPDTRLCQVVRLWNQEHDEIKLRTSTLSEWFTALQAQDTGDWPTYQAAWPDHWSHGLGSMTAPVAIERRTQRRKANGSALAQELGSKEAALFLETSREQERLALEHTFDAYCTGWKPDDPLNDYQKAAKELTFHRAAMYLDEAGWAALRNRTDKGTGPDLYVNSTDAFSGLRSVHFEQGDAHVEPLFQALASEDGEIYPFQADHRSLREFVAALPIHPGLNGFHLVQKPQTGGSRAASPGQKATMLQNSAWQLEVDAGSGGLRSLVERASGREWVDTSHVYGFGQLVHETVIHPWGRAAAGNTNRLIHLGIASQAAREAFPQEPVFARKSLAIDDLPVYEPGPVFDTISLQGRFSSAGKAGVSWRLYHAIPLVELALDWDKTWSDLPEAAYVAFPFQAPQAGLSLETSGGFFRPGYYGNGGQLQGTCSYYYTVQRAARIDLPQGSPLFWLPLDAPLVMTNAIDFNRWGVEPWEWNGFLASMPVNHYWHTNFPTSQRGYLRLRYRIASSQGMPDEQAIQSALPLDAIGWRP
ncbi:MAG: hypothetical protein ACM3PY_03245 [Omnitrophica WOR_2 bacterium]